MTYLEYIEQKAFSEGYAQRMFDEKEEKKKKGSVGAKALVGLGMAGTVVGGEMLSNEIAKKAAVEGLLKRDITASDEEKIRKALLDKAEKDGAKIYHNPTLPNSGYMGGPYTKSVRKHCEKTEKGRALLKNPFAEHLGEDAIVLGGGNLSKADVIAHELGHREAAGLKSKASFAKAAHYAAPVSKLAGGTLGNVGWAVNGFKSGQKAVRDGDKESTWNKARATALPAAVMAPLLVSEAAASRRGIKMLKEAGASKELLEQSKKRLRGAFGSYVPKAALPVVSGEAGRLMGKAYERSKKDEKD